MKKLFLSLIVTALGALGMYAQDEFIATLNHGSELSTFFGENALAQACEAAENGDVITLSPGVFLGCSMDKAITLRGAGYKPMAGNNYVPTQITGGLTVYPSSKAGSAFEMECLEVLCKVKIIGDSLAPVRLNKCLFQEAVQTYGISMNAHSCIFNARLQANGSTSYAGDYMGLGTAKNTTLNCNNCVMRQVYANGLDTFYNKIGKIRACNCILLPFKNGSLEYSVIINSIILGGYPVLKGCSVVNCIGINTNNTDDLFAMVDNPGNQMVEGYGDTAFSEVFKTWKNENFSSYETYELTDEAAARYLGDDGTQVGVYGGASPFNVNPTTPQVTKFSVNSTTENGQLKVKINVE